MRPFRFRAWDKDKKIMIHDICDENTENWAHLYGLKLGDRLHPMVWNIGILNQTLMQFTGLKDVNWRDIYEGDIIRCIYSPEEEPQIVIGLVSWDDKEALFRIVSDHEPEYLYECIEYAEIIGNVHEHPELIYTVLD